MKTSRLVGCGLVLTLLSGCALQEIRSKSKFGPEFRHSGTQNTSEVRWYAQQGLDFKWDKGIKTGITYRRRDVDEGSGSNDNGIWLDFSFPIWKASPKADKTAMRIRALEKHIAQMEAQRQQEDHLARAE